MSGKLGLGKGLGSLIPETLDIGLLVEDSEHVRKLALDQIVPQKDQPRTVFDPVALKELAASIQQYGIVQPLVVSPVREGYVIIAGERRWRAAKLAGLKTVPAIIRTTKELEQLEIALVENVQRVDLGPLEQAVSIERLHQQFNLSYSSIAQRLGKAETTISNIVRLLQLPPDACDALREGRMSEGHARQILALKAMPQKQRELLAAILSHGWSVRETERFVSATKSGMHAAQAAHKRVATETTETKQLSKQYGVPVTMYRTAKGGRVQIHFRSEEELRHILQTLSSSHSQV